MSAQEVIEIKQAIFAAHVAEGYVKPDGGMDKGAVRQRIVEILLSAVVSNESERRDKPVTRGQMAEQVFPSLPASLGDQDPELAEAALKEIRSSLWAEVSPSASAPIRKYLPNGYMVARVKIGKDPTWASYLTENRLLVEKDVFKPGRDSVARKARAETDKAILYIGLHPEEGPRVLKAHDDHLKSIGSAGHDRIVQAIDSATVNGQEPEVPAES
jgi:hypothetical protein